MNAAASFFLKASLQHARACLGICRHCLESTTSAQPCHADLNDTIVALEIAVALLETKSEHAYDRLRHCAEVCAASVEKWGHSPHPHCRQSAGACQTFVAFWRGQVL
ncbi:MAG: hypothetical protein ACI81P_003161 [Neolewinella sp.]|jgi:hypothetical protein